jgi:hypothetical protein
MAQRPARQRHLKPVKATEGAMPKVTYILDSIEEHQPEHHFVSCDCPEGFFVRTSDEGVARYAASAHFAKHARRRIQPPEVEQEPA